MAAEPPRRPDRQRGSSLMLMPAAVLVFVILGAFAVDFAAVHLGQRELVAAAQGAANDAAVSGFSNAAFYEQGEVRFDPAGARRAAAASLAASDPEYVLRSVRIVDGAVVVEVEATVPTIFAKAVPGGPNTFIVDARATADLDQ